MGFMSEYNVKKNNVLKLYKYIQNQKKDVKKEESNNTEKNK